ncbi:MAG: hypothetical protein GY723_05700 [bacterium]|nr:hypothetical protein [bacterium]MCP5070383.1 hypothetical protein [bacterium]
MNTVGQASEAKVDILVVGSDLTENESMLFREMPSGDRPQIHISDVVFRVCQELAESTKRVRFLSFTEGVEENLRCDQDFVLRELGDWIGVMAHDLDLHGGGRIEIHTLVRHQSAA